MAPPAAKNRKRTRTPHAAPQDAPTRRRVRAETARATAGRSHRKRREPASKPVGLHSLTRILRKLPEDLQPSRTEVETCARLIMRYEHGRPGDLPRYRREARVHLWISRCLKDPRAAAVLPKVLAA
jgi:hypothetical protein